MTYEEGKCRLYYESLGLSVKEAADVCKNDALRGSIEAAMATGLTAKQAYDYFKGLSTKGEAWLAEYRLKSAEGDALTIEKLFMLLVFLRLTKTEKGLEVLKVLGKEFIKGIFDTLHALGQASAANKVASWANPYLVLLVLDRFGFVYKKGASEFKLGLNVVTGAEVAEGFIDTVQGLFPFGSPEPSEYPSNISFSSRTEGDTTTESVAAKGLTTEQMQELRKAIAKK